ncbi:MAG TPA: DUF2071 domain-containing protein [Chthonomonadaceae bacterium]|nr:DUF2071 domain-containing protein [Chthonomonadaceae bacterium]
MFQCWNDLLLAHWPVLEESLRPLVPEVLPIDTFEGQAWLGITPFRLTDAHARFLPSVPGLSSFLELNVRTYVTVEDKPGVYFFSLDASNPVAVTGARQFFYLPYFTAEMDQRVEEGWIYFHSRRAGGTDSSPHLRTRYRPTGEVFQALPGTLEYFLIERYCLYTMEDQHLYRCEIHHPPWPVQPATAEFEENTMASAQGIALPETPPLLHFAETQPTIVWPLFRLS